MYDYLVVRLSEGVVSPEAAAEWMLLGRDSQQAEVQTGDLAATGAYYTQLADKPVVIVLAPARDILLSDVVVPSGQQRYAKQALPFLVEEKLADDIEDVHIAMGPLHKQQAVPIAVARHFDVINWLDALYSVGLPTTWLVPEQLALPWTEGRTRVYLDRAGCLVRRGDWQGMGCDYENIEVVTRSVLESLASNLPQLEIAYSEEDELLAEAEALRNSLLGDLSVEVSLLAYRETLTEVLARQVVSGLSDTINLLQGGYSVKTPGLRGSLNLRKLTTTFASCMACYLAFTVGAGIWLEWRTDNMKSEAVTQYKQWFPEARRVFDPRRQLQSKLANEQGAGSDTLLSYIGAVAADWQSGSDLRLQAMDYQGQSGSMTLQLAAPAAESMASLQNELRGRGLQSELKSVSQRGELVTGRLELGRAYR